MQDIFVKLYSFSIGISISFIEFSQRYDSQGKTISLHALKKLHWYLQRYSRNCLWLLKSYIMVKNFQLLSFKSVQLNIFEVLLKNVLQNEKVFSKMHDGISWNYEDTIIAWYISNFAELTINLYWIRFACVNNCILHPA